ncbi:MAG TPA: hypothetical protein G4N94_14025 [Caldilineae bacterium]|nr:hypothetical protein [Caldilineae bacterium]
MISSDRSLLAAWLRAIPQSRHEPIPLRALPGGDVIGRGLAAMLAVWGAVELSERGIRAVSQPAYYFLHSLAAWAETPGAVITDWSEEFGADKDEGLRHGSSLVYLLEAERLSRIPDAAPIRFTPVAQALIIQPGEPPRFLAQWDEQAGSYQVIGGRQRVNQDWIEPIRDTIIREVEEELDDQVSFAAGDFDVEQLAQFQGKTALSPTFGALTAYHFTFFRVTGLTSLQLASSDRWLTRHELLSGRTTDGESVRGDHILRLERTIGRRIDELPSSFVNLKD